MDCKNYNYSIVTPPVGLVPARGDGHVHMEPYAGEALQSATRPPLRQQEPENTGSC